VTRLPHAAARRQRGVALIAALLVVALAVVLVAALLDTGEATRARARNGLRAEQTWQLMHGLEAWAASVLISDQEASEGIDSPGEPWSQPMPPLQIPGGQVYGRLRQWSGCFDLNSLYRDDAPNAAAQARFERLLDALRVDRAVAAQALDWIDPDGQAVPGGAEDLAYQLRRPGYRAANQPFRHVSELRLLAAVDADVYRLLLPHVCALPEPAPTNLNFASPALWMSIDAAITEVTARRLAADGQARYASLEVIERELAAVLPGVVLPPDAYGVHSEYFVAEADIVVDGIPYAYASLLRRRGNEVSVLQRTRGRL
jgi:general secretion pathway protein K